MKKTGIIKRFSLTALTLVLCLAVMVTCFTFFVPQYSAHAEEPFSVSADAVSLGDVSLDKECEYGKQFEVKPVAGTTVTVTAPDGKAVEPTENKVTANQIGNYKVTYEKEGVSYDFYVRVKLAEDYFLKVDFNGADIPSYVQVGTSFVLPNARVVYYDDNNILQELKGCTFKVSDSNGATYNIKSETAADKTFSAGTTAKRVFITYSATVGEGTKTLSKTFTVNVQSKVENSGNPTINVSGVQRDVSINRPVTLPKATATDSSDDNVKIVITVTKDGVPVTNVDIDEDGYAYKEEGKEYDDVLFDNDQAMTFYPTETGSYKVTYQAFNDANIKDSNTGMSSLREYYMTVSDLVAPVFKNVDEYRIPETWGKNVKGATGVDTSNLGGKITFTVPDIVDNNKAEGNELKIYFRITDADNSKTVVTFDNILDTEGDGNKFTPNSTYGKVANADATEAIVFDKDHPFTFDFSEYVREEGSDNYGTYTVLYRARDKANNTSSKTYTIKFQENYTDSAAPTTAEVTVPDYISAADETLTIPYAKVADASDTRLKKDYRIYTDAQLGEGDVRYIEVDGGEIADIDDGYLVINKDKKNEKKLLLGSNLYFYVGATDDVGNRKTNAEDNADLTAEDASSEVYKTVEAKVVVLSSNTKTFVYNNEDTNGTPDAVTFKNADEDKTEIQAGDTVIANGFSIRAGSYGMRNYTGYEVAVYDPNGNALNVTLETVNAKVTEGEEDTDAIIYVQNIKFNAAVSTEAEEDEDAKYYTLVVRVFDVNGNNSIYGYKLTGIQPSDQGNVSTQAIQTIGSSGTVNVTYKLNNEVIKGITGKPGTYFVARKISGGVFSLMGIEFTAKTQGSYSVQDGYINAENVTAVGSYSFKDDVNFAGANEGVYNFSITDNSAPVIEMQGDMQTYWAFPESGAKSVTVKLPTVVAYTETGMATVDVEVKDPDSYDVELEKDDDDNELNEFVATKDGVYTVTYTATYKNATPVTSTYNISVGDVIAPQFTLVDGTGTSTTATLRVGDEFTFATMQLADGESTTGVTITKKLIDPSHEEVTDATVSGTYSGKREEKNNGTTITFNMAGTYEVVYTATDAVGNPSMQRVTITVVSSGSSTPTTWTTLSTVLIIVAVVLLAGVIIYVVRFRKVKK